MGVGNGCLTSISVTNKSSQTHHQYKWVGNWWKNPTKTGSQQCIDIPKTEVSLTQNEKTALTVSQVCLMAENLHEK